MKRNNEESNLLFKKQVDELAANCFTCLPLIHYHSNNEQRSNCSLLRGTKQSPGIEQADDAEGLLLKATQGTQ